MISKKKGISFLLSVLLLGPGFSAESESPRSSSKKIFTTLDTTTGTNFYRFRSANNQCSSDFTINPEFRGEKYLLGATGGFNKSWRGYREETASDGTFYGKKNLFSRGNFSLGSSATLLLPWSEESWNDNGLLTAISLASILSWDLGPLKLKHVTFSYVPALTKYFHRYRTSYSGSTNVSFRIKQGARLSYSPRESWTFALTFSEAERWSYGGERKDSLYQSSLAASWSKGIYGVGAELSNEGSVYRPNGIDPNVKLLNNETMMFYLSVNVMI